MNYCDNGAGTALASIRERAGQYPMTDGGEPERRRGRRQLGRRSRRRWAIAGGVVVGWLILEFMTGSAGAATVILVGIALLVVACAAAMRALGITRDHPLVRRATTRPWRDGQDVMNVAVRHLSDVFVVTPNGSVFAPDFVELQMNPDDLASLRAWMELDVVSGSVTEVYQEQVAKRGARFIGSGRPEVYLVPEDSLPQGRYRLRRGLAPSDRYSPGAWDLPAGPDRFDRRGEHVAEEYPTTSVDPVGSERGGDARYPVEPGRTIMDGMATVMEQIRPAVPVLRLVTGSWVTETSMSGARAGRGPVELELPYAPTVSRVHARFTFSEGRWWVTNEGMNGLSVNGAQVSGLQPLSDGDSIRWGKGQDAPESRIEIG